MDRDLYEDIKVDPEIMTKLQDRRYAQNVYAALCNIRWQPKEVWPVLQDEYWSCSWRSAGGFVANLRNNGEDYMDYYCTGIRGGFDLSKSSDEDYFAKNGYVSEGEVTDEIREDFARLGWTPSPWPKDDL